MVAFSALSLSTLLLAAHSALAAPRPDSAIGDEVAVSAPNGTPITDTKELASQTAAEAAASKSSAEAAYQATAMADVTSSSEYVQYTSSSNQYDNSNQYASSSSVDNYNYNQYTTSSLEYNNQYTTSSVEYNQYTTSTSSAYVAANTVSYGSGSSNWGNSGYNDCVQQCIASFGAPAATYTPPTSTDSSDSSSGNGVTHTIIVAPTQGVLRYVPFAVNASVGDTIQFQWNANMHTVTKSSEFELCNKTSDAPFTSGVQNKSFVFTQVVNSTDPTFFYCGVPTHCQKGMFGIINPPNAAGSSSSVDNMMTSISSNSSDVAAWAAYAQKSTSGNAAAAGWGGSIDMAKIPDEAKDVFAENVLYTRTFLGMNKDVLKSDGSVDLGASGGAPIMIPQDISALAAASSSASSVSSATSAGAQASGTGASDAAQSSSVGASTTSGSRKGMKVSSSAVVGLVALGAALFAL
ncbi:extracellular serine-rich [Pyrrhoderma noxium]|uniref:Extracellular serine-rich n=1 Tax=Pyrrhoderma noxium TaxID=2282107 RepID=A0A286UUG4_9AGAM|nr:extracellular serine-rich [Pyrrhoderma noxium]